MKKGDRVTHARSHRFGRGTVMHVGFHDAWGCDYCHVTWDKPNHGCAVKVRLMPATNLVTIPVIDQLGELV